jgi:hypothetical protein
VVNQELVDGPVVVDGQLGVLDVPKNASELLDVESLVNGSLLFFVVEVHVFAPLSTPSQFRERDIENALLSVNKAGQIERVTFVLRFHGQKSCSIGDL